MGATPRRMSFFYQFQFYKNKQENVYKLGAHRIPWPDGPAPINLRHQDGFTFDLGVVVR